MRYFKKKRGRQKVNFSTRDKMSFLVLRPIKGSGGLIK